MCTVEFGRSPSVNDGKIGQKPFIFNHVQGFPQYVLLISNQCEELEFLNYVKFGRVKDVPTDADIMSSHTDYKINVEVDDPLHL